MSPRRALRQATEADTHGQPRATDDADGLADDEPEHHAADHPGLEPARFEAYARVRERERGDDGKVHPWAETVLESLERRRRLGGQTGEALERDLVVVSLVVADDPVFEAGRDLIDHRPGFHAEQLGLVERAGRREQSEHDADDGGLDACLVQREPAHAAEGDVRHHRADVGPTQQHRDADAHGGHDQPADVEVLCVEHRDDDDAADVVDDGQRQDEHLGADRHARTGQGDDAERERDVGRHRHAPTVRADATVVDRDVEHGRHDHAAEGGEHRQRGRSPIAQLAEHELALHLEPGEQEEERHRRVVDPPAQREVTQVDEIAQPHGQLGRPESFVAGVPWRVRPAERQQRRDDHDGGRGAVV